MKKRLIKKAFKCAAKGIHTRIIPRGNGGKNIAVFIQFKIIGMQAKKIKRFKSFEDIMKFTLIIALATANIRNIMSQPTPKLKKGGIIIGEKGREILLSSDENIISCQ